jgi:hypothetical protein
MEKRPRHLDEEGRVKDEFRKTLERICFKKKMNFF